MVGVLASIAEPVQRGFRWWTGELAELVPAVIVDRSLRQTPGVVVLVDAAGLRLLDERAKSRSRPRGGASNLEAEPFEALLELANQRPVVPVRLRLPYTQCFSRIIDLPEAARKDVGRILELDLERATPFRSKDVYTAHVVETAQVRPGVLRIRQFIVPRKSIDGALAEVRATGVTVAGVECWNPERSAPLPVNFLASEGGGTATPSRALKMLILAAALLVSSAVYLVTSQHERALAELEQNVAQTRVRADAVRNLVRVSEDQLKDLNALKGLVQNRMMVVSVIDSLTRLLPDSAWLTDLRIDGDTVDISGFSKSAASLIPILETSSVFSEAAFTSAVTRDPSEAKERFSMKLRVRKQGGSSKVSPIDPDTEIR